MLSAPQIFVKKNVFHDEAWEEICRPVSSGLNSIDPFIRQILDCEIPPLNDGREFILKTGGKRLRPLLVLLSRHALLDEKKQDPKAVELAALVEMIHTASLFHDDVVDEAETRRGVKSMNARWGNRLPILMGDYFYSTVFTRLVQGFDPIIVEAVAGAVRSMALGEILQNSFVCSSCPSLEDYFSVIDQKTASFLSACAKSGALLGGAEEETASAFEEYGRNLGMAFQIVDDILDWSGAPEQLGKGIGLDLARGNWTLPLLIYAEAHSLDLSLLMRGETSEEKREEFLQLVIASGTLEEAKETAVRYAEEARKALSGLQKRCKTTDSLTKLTYFVLDRTS